MKDNIFSIHNDLKEGKMTWKEAEKKLFILFDVVQQSEQCTYDCKVCGKPFGDKLSLYEHYDAEHN